ncbi:DarT ssDNA thymidine ADP-ribosyltransferase family protein [Priestia megaterium]|uniref:DarT ssDNA thymidine ADP-ribosyltransferase family protein n=1 Tax=Priestia megaterium TaxID=1404 RepID=UPI0023D9E939|nr:DarT ssDNA thymidine ADP-ribosyltransferase family protein [Priestia megaterium]MDF2052995.1 DarT ssDNA thymidine ADP-ribosyltransferase family protein [Priestia megaterium]MDF2062243.1 DarT ssDNA thymidine ADP-ribosyltransferase family protein [Priestia megaterium]
MKNAVNESGIRFLVHFTQARNLSSILQNGILPITDLNSRYMSYGWNDAQRLDGFHNASCFSIERPNYKMFYKYRNENPQLDWVVLGIKKEVLWEKDCAFCVENAASNSITRTSIESRKGVQAFKRLYHEFPNKPTRENLKLHPILPTNPQAEVLIFGEVEPSYIFAVAFENNFVRDRYKQFVPNNVVVETQKWLYEPRHDYEYWR